MNIKEVETLSGMTRANIRFYEQEGLIDPVRRENGYRDYSEEDLQQLQRIRLLRTLGLGLEDIRSLQRGETQLSDVLQRHTDELQQQSDELVRRAQVCRTICHDGASYQTLDPQPYLAALSSGEAQEAPVPREDIYHKVRAPWRRYFARFFDQLVYSLVWMLIGLLLLHKSPGSSTGDAWNGFASLVSIIMMLFAEPLLLRTWGTTPGKWLLGLSVRSNTGQKLTYGEGFYRTVQALWYGAGFHIPIYSIVRGYKCYYDCTDGKTLEWEWDSELILQDEKNWRIAAYTGGVIALFGVLMLSTGLSATPIHRGDMTVAEFAESYNRMSDYYETGGWMDEQGRWSERPSLDGSVTINMRDIEAPDFVYTVEDGVITGMSFTMVVENDTESWVPLYSNRRILALLTFVQAYDPTPMNNEEVYKVIPELVQHPFDHRDATVHGVRMTYQLESTGYYQADTQDVLIPIEGETPSMRLHFSLQKVSAPGA